MQHSPGVREFLTDPQALACPWVESPFFSTILEGMDAPEELKRLARDFSRDGYVILDDVFEPELVERVVGEYPRLFDPNTKFDVGPSLAELLKRDPSRKQDAWFVSESVREMACHSRVMEILDFLYGREAFAFQTLNFLPGTQQTAHSDNMHFSSMPAGFMCGVWVALEDVTEENGPLFYYPRSHKLSELQISDLGLWAGSDQTNLGSNYERFEAFLEALIETHGLEQQRLTIKKGQALIWSANLIHGGCPITRPGMTRKSQVTHYYFRDCLYYTPIFSDSQIGEWFLRENILDVATGERVKQNLNGAPVKIKKLRSGRSRLDRA